jgi:Zn-dependent protease
VAFAGPGTNILLAVVFSLLIRFSSAQLGPELVAAFSLIIYINLVLAVFNLLPVPPLDGSKVLSTLLGMVSPALERVYDTFRLNFERLGMLTGTLLLLALFYFLSPYFIGFLQSIFSLLTGVSI